MTIRRAVIKDTSGILDVIQPYVDDGILLPVQTYRLYERIRDFIVAEVDGVIIGCGSLMIMWHDLAEIRSLVIRRGRQGGGIGRRIVEALLDEARTLGMAKVFALTYQTEFFVRVGFQVVAKEKLPHKVWKDCTHCPRFTHCEEIAVEMVLIPDADISSGPPSLPVSPDPNLLIPTPAD